MTAEEKLEVLIVSQIDTEDVEVLDFLESVSEHLEENDYDEYLEEINYFISQIEDKEMIEILELKKVLVDVLYDIEMAD